MGINPIAEKKEKNYFITGCSGFIAYHFLNMLDEEGIKHNVYGIDIREPVSKTFKNIKFRFDCIELSNNSGIYMALRQCDPDYVVHFASGGLVGDTWENPSYSFYNNVNITLNLLELVKEIGYCKTLLIGSGVQYGEGINLDENSRMNPINLYGIGKITQEMMGKFYGNVYNSYIVMTRSFPHVGGGQGEKFLIPSLISQMLKKDEIVVENLNVEIDYLDVRDAVRAYDVILKYGKKGEVYNVCSGYRWPVSYILGMISDILGYNKSVIEKNARLVEYNCLTGDNKKLCELGWKRQYDLVDTLEWMIDCINLLKNKQ